MSGGDFDELNEGLRMEGGASLSLALLLCHLAVEHEMDPMDVLQEQQVGFTVAGSAKMSILNMRSHL
jgi:hypothetical protein